jgi:hypothetical protein
VQSPAWRADPRLARPVDRPSPKKVRNPLHACNLASWISSWLRKIAREVFPKTGAPKFPQNRQSISCVRLPSWDDGRAREQSAWSFLGSGLTFGLVTLDFHRQSQITIL